VSEETKSADWTSAWGILVAVFMSVVLGFAYVIALLFSIQVSLHLSRILRVVLHVACCMLSTPAHAVLHDIELRLL